MDDDEPVPDVGPADGATQADDERLLEAVRASIAERAVPYVGKRRRVCYIAWDFEFTSAEGTTYFAFSPPYGYADLQEYLGRLGRFFDESPASGTPLPAYMPQVESGGATGSFTPQRAVPIRPETVDITIEHGALEPPRRMRVTVRKDATLLQVREAIAQALGIARLYEVKLVKRLGRSSQLTTLADTERLNRRTHLLMLGRDFEDGFVAPPPLFEDEEAAVDAAPAQDGAAASWLPRCGAGVYFHRQRLCVTPDGRRVDMLTVSQEPPPTPRKLVEVPPSSMRSCSVAVGGETPARFFGERQVVFVSARVHPGETPGQFAFFGLLQFLLSNDPRAELLRQHFVFKLVPMLNPDGVGRGHTRTNASGLDLNRCYADPKPQEHEGVFWVLEWLTHWADQGRLLFYLDMHAHAHTRGCVLYGNNLNGVAQIWNVAFAHLCQLNGPHFDVDGCEFPPMADKEHGYDTADTSGRARAASACKLYHAYTLECHYSVGRLTRPVQDAPGLEGRPVHPSIAVKTCKQVPYGVPEWESIGEAIAVTLLDLHGSNPFLRPSVNVRAVLEAIAEKQGFSKAHPGLAAPPAVAAQRDEDARHLRESQLWRVVNTTVAARDAPALGRALLELFSEGQLVSVLEEVPGTAWVQLAAPDGFLGGKLNLCIGEGKNAYMLTDGSSVGLGRLLERTDMWIHTPSRRAASQLPPLL